MDTEIRFGAMRADGKCSSTWKCWTFPGTEKRDVFLACREAHGDLKASLHQSGQWHVAFDGKKFSSMFGPGQAPERRFMTTVARPPVFANGLTVACRIVSPWSAVTRGPSVGKKPVVWLPCPPEGMALCVLVLLSDDLPQPGTWAGRWGGPNVSWVEYENGIPSVCRAAGWATENVGCICPPSGGSVQVVYQTGPFQAPPPAQLGPQGGLFKGVSQEDLLKKGLRALMWGTSQDGALQFIETGVTVSRGAASDAHGTDSRGVS